MNPQQISAPCMSEGSPDRWSSMLRGVCGVLDCDVVRRKPANWICHRNSLYAYRLCFTS